MDSKSANIDIDICGNTYTVPRRMFECGPSSRLSRMYKEKIINPNIKRIFINRPIEGFLAILSYYQTCELHMPMTSCPVAFLNELEYWEISPDILSECCYNRVQSYLSDLETLRTFKEQQTKSATLNQQYNCLKGCRAKISAIVEYTKPSLIGKVYLAVTFLMVIISILVMAYSTDPNFQRFMTNCERLDYMHASGLADYDTVKPYLKQICSKVDIPNGLTNTSENTTIRLERHINKTENNFLLFLIHEEHIKNKTFPNNSSANDNIFGLNNFTEQVLPNESLINNMNNKSENNSQLPGGFQSFFYIKEAFQTTKEIKVPNFKARIFVLVVLDGITTLFFTMDIMIRLLTCPSVRRYFSSVINCADIISLLGIYLYLILFSICTHLRYGSWIDRLAYMQVLRVLRFFRIIVNVRAGKVMWYSVRKNIKDLSILVLFLITAMTTFASCFYIAESGKPFNSIPDAWYRAIITLTTVGYGDIHPQSKTGRLVACVCAVSGILLLALTVPVFANNFLLLYQHTETENIVTKFRKRSKKSKRQRKMHSSTGDD